MPRPLGPDRFSVYVFVGIAGSLVMARCDTAPCSVEVGPAGQRTRWMHAFVRGDNGRLYVNWFNGNQWAWADQGAPVNTSAVGDPAATTYHDGTTQLINVFAPGANGFVHTNHWNGTRWGWHNLVGRPGVSNVNSVHDAIAYEEAGIPSVRVFARAGAADAVGMAECFSVCGGFSIWHWR